MKAKLFWQKKTNVHADYVRAEDIGIAGMVHSKKNLVTDSAAYIYIAEALSEWPKQSKDREFLEKLYATVFSKFQRILSRLSRIIPSKAACRYPHVTRDA